MTFYNTNQYTTRPLIWENINWKELGSYLHNLQYSIYDAATKNEYQKIYDLQFRIINDFSAKLLAVRQSAQLNSGNKTSWLDGALVLTGSERINLALNLQIDGLAYPIKRLYIPKPGSPEMRLLSIPILLDRAKQTLVNYALEPQFEAYFETNSYGFRPMRFAYQAINKIRGHLISNGPSWILNTNVKKCFYLINHNSLLDKIHAIQPIDYQLRAWFMAGIFDKGEIIYPRTGICQGGTISPLLANIALNGIQKCIFEEIGKNEDYKHPNSVTYVRYADDLVVLSPIRSTLDEIIFIINRELATVGLSLKPEKTRIIHSLTYDYHTNRFKNETFEFLGYKFIQRIVSIHRVMRTKSPIIVFDTDGQGTIGYPFPYSLFDSRMISRRKQENLPSLMTARFETYMVPSFSRLQRHKTSIRLFIKSCGTIEQLIIGLNSRITGWCNYFRHSDASTFCNLPRKLDLWLNRLIKVWLKKSVKSKRKSEKYWKKESKDWILYTMIKINHNQEFELTLKKYSSFKWKIPRGKMPYDSSFTKYMVFNLDDLETMNENVSKYLGFGLE